MEHPKHDHQTVKEREAAEARLKAAEEQREEIENLPKLKDGKASGEFVRRVSPNVAVAKVGGKEVKIKIPVNHPTALAEGAKVDVEVKDGVAYVTRPAAKT